MYLHKKQRALDRKKMRRTWYMERSVCSSAAKLLSPCFQAWTSTHSGHIFHFRSGIERHARSRILITQLPEASAKFAVWGSTARQRKEMWINKVACQARLPNCIDGSCIRPLHAAAQRETIPIANSDENVWIERALEIPFH